MNGIFSRPLSQSKGEIRLLTLVRSDGSPLSSAGAPKDQLEVSSTSLDPNFKSNHLSFEDIYCKLDHFPLRTYGRNDNDARRSGNESPSQRFVALSYTWGSEDELAMINVNGHALQVRRNLKHALEALRSVDLVSAGYKIWIDALCIDQKSHSERNREITRMADIYQSASNVIVWLGNAADGSDEVVDFINAVCEARVNGINAVRRYIRGVFATQGATLWDRMTCFITRPYFFRLWITQEIVMGGGRDTMVLCGDKVTTWERMHQVYHNFQILEGKKGQSRDESLTTAVRLELQSTELVVYHAYRDVDFWKWQKCEDIRFLRDMQALGQNRATASLLNRCRVALCSNPLDKVYGILGLLSKPMAAKIHTDYGHDTRQVMMDFTRAWIESEGTLLPLIQTGSSGEHYKRDTAIPSWVIDLRQEVKQKILQGYNASGQKRAPVSFIRNGAVLSVKGVLFDTVDGTSGIRNREEDYNNAPDMIQNSAYHENPYDEDFSEVLWRTLVGNRDRYGNVAAPSSSCVLDSAILDPRHAPPLGMDKRCEYGVDSLYWNMHLWMRRNANFLVHRDKPLKHFLCDSKMLDEQPELYQQCAARALKFLWYTRLITTERGYLGSAPRPVQRGDLVAVLLGCPAPLVLRRYGDTFEIIAECYLEGIMKGEVARGIDKGEYGVEEILIS